MKLSEIAQIPDRDEQLAQLVLHSQRSSRTDFASAISYLDGVAFPGRFPPDPRRIRQIARRHGLDLIRLDDFLPAEDRPDRAAQDPEPTPAAPTTEAETRAALAANPSLRPIVKEAFDEGLIDGLRSVRVFVSAEEADAAWNAQPGYVSRGPAMPASHIPNLNPDCQLAHVCSRITCNAESCPLHRRALAHIAAGQSPRNAYVAAGEDAMRF